MNLDGCCAPARLGCFSISASIGAGKRRLTTYYIHQKSDLKPKIYPDKLHASIHHRFTPCSYPLLHFDPPMSSMDSLKMLFRLGAGLLLDRGTGGAAGGLSGLTGPLLPFALT